jgi:hypothetical protein
MTITAMALSSAAIEVLGQLFVKGPTWDGNISSKSGRGELCEAGLAERGFGWAWLTRDGVQAAVEWKAKDRHDQRWYRKAATLD